MISLDEHRAITDDDKFAAIAEQICRDYRANIFGSNDEVKMYLDEYAVAIFAGQYGVPPASVFHAMLDPIFLESGVGGEYFGMFMPAAHAALGNPACPPLLIALAACSRHALYRQAARENPACPPEYEVYVALWRGSR